MATYKVIQDIEAEDKLVGPLTLRQFIYACIAAVCAYLSFIFVAKGVAFLLVITAPPMFFTGFFAFPWGRDQPTEVWALAKIRFLLKPRRRIWDQSGMKDLVNITAPKRVERSYTNGLTPHEVQSRLTALASTLDTRGWAIKNSAVNLSALGQAQADDSDRLVSPTAAPQEVSDIMPSDDILDPISNPSAQRLDVMITESSKSRRQKLMERMHLANRAGASPAATQAAASAPAAPAATGASATVQLPAPADYWFLNKPLDLTQTANSAAAPAQPQSVSIPTADASAASMPAPAAVPVAAPIADAVTMGTPAPAVPVAAIPTADEEALAEQLKQQREKAQQAINFQHMKVIQPLGSPQAAPEAMSTAIPPEPSVTPARRSATIQLARNNDLNISTLARIANGQDENEVVISLHNHVS